MLTTFTSCYSRILCVQAIPAGTLLEKYAHSADYSDCFELSIETKMNKRAHNDVDGFVKTFFNSTAFFPERIILWTASRLYRFPPLKESGEESQGFGFFRLLDHTRPSLAKRSSKTPSEIIYDWGGGRSWFMVQSTKIGADRAEITYSFGSTIKHTNWFVDLLTPLHKFYAKVLLAGAIQSLAQQESASK